MPEVTPALAMRLAASFAIGSIPFAVLAMWGTGIDIRKYGSGNPGFNNVLRYSRWRAVVTLVGDLVKGMLPIWLFGNPTQSQATPWLYGLAAIAGHCFSPFLRFQGGKGIATSTGVMLYLYPKWALLSSLCYIAGRVMGKRRQWVEAGALSSVGASVVLAILLAIFETAQAAAGAALLVVFLAWRHKKNWQILRDRNRAATVRER